MSSFDGLFNLWFGLICPSDVRRHASSPRHRGDVRERSREGLQRELEVGGGRGRRRGFRKVSLLSVAGVLGGIPEGPAPECPAGLEREQVGGEKSYLPPTPPFESATRSVSSVSHFQRWTNVERFNWLASG